MSLRQIVSVLVFVAVLVLLIWNSGPILIAFLTAILLEPLNTALRKTIGLKRAWSTIITFCLFLLAFSLGSYWVGTTVIVQGVEFAERLPHLSKQVMITLEGIIQESERYYDLLPSETVVTIQEVLASFHRSAIEFTSTIGKWILGIIAGIPELLIKTIIYLVGLFLISMDLPKIQATFMNLFSPSARGKVELVLNQLHRAAVGFLGAQVILSVLTYILALIGLLILDINYAAVIALVVIIVDILPILGTGSVFVPWATYLFINGQKEVAIGLIILFVVITVVRRIIEPKILGTSLGISALSAFASMIIGFQMIGLLGLILGPAIVIIIQALRSAGFMKFKIDF